jgi:glucose-6-phosphate dehydrogenase assembly protein OpcA
MPIQPESLNKEISELWVTLAQRADGPNAGVVRSSSMTLIALVDQEHDSTGLSETLAGLMRSHPNRAIVIHVSKGNSEDLDAEVRAQCWLPTGQQKQLCSEQIEINASEKSLADLPSVLLPLVVPDLPVVLWCRSERSTQLPVFNELIALGPRVIFDIADFKDPLSAFKRIEGISKSGFAVTDLNWTRLTRWRDMIAQVFENVACRKDLPRFRTITLNYHANPVSGVPVAAILMAGWLVKCLGWTGLGRSRREGGKRTLEFDEGARLIYQIVGPGGAGSRLAGLSIEAPDDPAIEIKLARTQDRFLDVVVSAAGNQPVENRGSFPPSDDVSVLGEELSIARRDDVFVYSLPSAIRIASHWA